MKFIFTLIFTLAIFIDGIAGAVKGTIRAESNTPLSYPYVAVKGQLLGIIANEWGEYHLNLPAGKYELIYQHLGHESQNKILEIKDHTTQIIDVRLKEQPLRRLQADRTGEDLSYSIMRKAIAKAQFHQLQLSSYTARTYARTTVNPVKIPYVLQRGLKKQGVQQGRAFINESLSDIQYERLNKYYQNILAIKNSLDNSIPAPNEYMLASFYNPTVVGTLSPLAPKSFSYYRFEYEGSFEDQGKMVHKIHIIPKAYGEGVFKGSICILQDDWAIHSFDIQTTARGLGVKINQYYKPIENVWVPVCQLIQIDGEYLGFKGELKYLVSMIYTHLNAVPDSNSIPIQDQLQQYDLQDTDSVKALTEILHTPIDKRIVRQDSILSNPEATNQSNDYWISERPVPLNSSEYRSYTHQDTTDAKSRFSIAKPDSSHFKILHLVTGKTYNFPRGNSLYLKSPLFSVSYNTVEGNALNLLAAWKKQWPNGKYLKISPLVRYALGSNNLYGDVFTTYGAEKWNFILSGGKTLNQFNSEFPISNLANSIASRFFNQSLMKLYQSTYVKGEFTIKDIGDIFQVKTSLGIENREEVYNLENAKPIFIWDKFGFVPNRPLNDEMENTSMPSHLAFLWDVHAQVSPWRKYALRNGLKKYISGNDPTFDVTLKQGITTSTFSGFTFLQAGIRQALSLGPRNTFSYRVNAGGFVGKRNLNFVDYKHFADNEFFIQFGDPLSEFRMLPRYRFSTGLRFYEAHGLLSMRRFFLTQFQIVRLTGITENIQIHHLHTPTLPNYTEVVYGLDNIYRVFRAEVVGQFNSNHFQSLRLRIGTSLPVSNIKR
jgi:hypothetical protein